MCKKAGIRGTGTNLPPAPHTEKAPQQAENRKSGAVRALMRNICVKVRTAASPARKTRGADMKNGTYGTQPRV